MKTLEITLSTVTRADSAIAEALDVSRSKVQKAIKNGTMFVDGKTLLVKTPLQGTVTITYDPSSFEAPDTQKEAPEPLVILYEDDDVIVVDKPAGVIVHPTETSTEATLVDALLAHYPELATVGDNPKQRPGIVHRLDKSASGVLIVAKNSTAYTHLKRQFKERLAHKTYLVLVHGTFEHPEGTIDLPISRSKSHGRMSAKPHKQGGKEAVTHYLVLESYRHHTLLEVRIETGRTHQIRVHMFSSDHPVVGDTLYRQRSAKQDALGRLFLHATSLEITLPNGETRLFEAPLPKELSDWLKTASL